MNAATTMMRIKRPLTAAIDLQQAPRYSEYCDYVLTKNKLLDRQLEKELKFYQRQMKTECRLLDDRQRVLQACHNNTTRVLEMKMRGSIWKYLKFSPGRIIGIHRRNLWWNALKVNIKRDINIVILFEELLDLSNVKFMFYTRNHASLFRFIDV